MEEKRRDAGLMPPASATDSPVAEQTSTRRRPGAPKRKANNLNALNSSSAPSKRVTREKSSISHSPIHNGPLTRARQSPSTLAPVAPASAAGAAAVKIEAQVAQAAALAEEAKAKANLNREALEAAIEAEFEAIRSRGSNAHVVPSHCGWFSWTKIHPLEERTLPSFFNGKSKTRIPEIYLEIRNWILKKFHANPNTQIELKDLSELEVGDLDARQEVMEFLDYWGLINFHPFPPTDPALTHADGDEAANKDSLIEKLYHFETLQSYPPVVPKTNLTTPAVPSGLFPESAVAEELARSEGPAGVDYHCNSCSADCSRRRYHCQKQADFDLCTDCFTNGKFGSNMSSSDFILMEPAEAPGVSGGKWTDQETLLLLEALELYKENWNEIAEHVATKTKAQCILKFVQMPIEDVFLDGAYDVDASSKGTADPAAINNYSSVPKEAHETTESKTGVGEGQPMTAVVETSKLEDASEVKDNHDTSKPEDASGMKGGEEALKGGQETLKGGQETLKGGLETLKPEGTSEVKDGTEVGENCALKALREAFEAVGYLPTPEGQLSFAEVGNPVMALAAFLARLVDPDVATASARSSLKSISGNSPSMQLAARHCFLLEDPPDDKKEPAGSESVAGIVNQDAQNEDPEVRNQKENNSILLLEDTNLSNDHSSKKSEDSVLVETRPVVSLNDKSIEKNDAIDTDEKVEPGNLNESSNSELPKENHPQSTVKESDDLTSKVEVSPSFEKKSQEGTSVGEPSLPTDPPKDVDMVSDAAPSKKNEPLLPVSSNAVEESSQPTEAPKDVDMVSDTLPSEKNESLQPVTSNSIVENGSSTGEGQVKNGEKENCGSAEIKDDHNIDRIKGAAASALSAAAVKAKLLANQEEDQIRHLVTLLIEKQLHKLETKLAFFNEMDNVTMRAREQLDRSRQRLYHERAQIIAARLGLPASSSRQMPSSLPTNRIAANFASAVARPPMSMTSQRPPISRPMGTMTPTTSNQFVSTTMAGSSIHPSS